MAEKRRFLDVWIVESNTVYREVPFPVVADWVQQGRLLEDDMLRRSGTAEWFKVGGSPDFAPYLPRPEPHRAEDTAEALEPVELDFHWKRRREDDDADVDMIPLIDVSLVLLVFFMMTASTAGLAAFVPTPKAAFGELSTNTDPVQLNINLGGDGRPLYSFSVGNKFLSKEDENLGSVDALLNRLQEHIRPLQNRVEVTINAHPDVRAGVVRELIGRLEDREFRERIIKKYYGVSDAVTE